MLIKRESLLNDLKEFAFRGNGIIIGSPGIGKTFLIKNLRQSLVTSNIPEVLLPIDQLGDGSKEKLERELSLNEDLIDFLKSIEITTNGIILFDAFDATRNEEARSNFLLLIQRAIQELPIWNVIVTVRTYDARKSRKLLELFEEVNHEDQPDYHTNDILCRHFTIPLLTNDEISSALDQIGLTKDFKDKCSEEFKKILSIPFNLWLLEKIITFTPEKNYSEISQIRSEVELLNRFWAQRVPIDAETRKNVLHRLSEKMMKERSLSTKVSDIYDDVGLDKQERKDAWETLQSDEILTKGSSTGGRVGFSHNILFDYAISTLQIEDDPREFEDFLNQDRSRGFFLRPSITYFFTSLWYDNKDRFWRIFWHILPKNQTVHLRLVARLIPTSVIANEVSNIKELNPLIEKLKKGETISGDAISSLLQSLLTFEINLEKPWIHFFYIVSDHLHADFAWDLAKLTSNILENTTDENVKDICGRIGRRLLQWVWDQKETTDNDWYNRLGGRMAVPLVAKTYQTDIDESRTLLSKVLDLIEEENFTLNFLTWLTETVNYIWDYDPDFVADIYKSVFRHIETSRERKNFGGYVLPMSTFRSQDYKMCQYRLIKHFPDFLKTYSIEATRAVVQSLNGFVIRKHIDKYPNNGSELNELMQTFVINNQETTYLEDGSYLWDAQEYTDNPIEMADVFFEYIQKLGESNNQELDKILKEFYNYVQVAFLWKRLLKIAVKSPNLFIPRLFELCLAEPILNGNDVIPELCSFIKNSSSILSENQLRSIEEKIIGLTNQEDEGIRESLEYHRNRLLGQIPLHLLKNVEAIEIRKEIEKSNSIPKNQHLVPITTNTEKVTDEMWFQNMGVDTSSPENQELQLSIKLIEEFNSNQRNKPSVVDVETIFPKLEEIYSSITHNNKAHEEVKTALWQKLSECCDIILQITNINKKYISFCREVLLNAAKHNEPTYHPEIDDNFDSTGYSPYPRHEAAKGLLNIAEHKPDRQILEAIKMLANDTIPSVRMVTAIDLYKVIYHRPKYFWRIIKERAENEENLIVQESLYYTLSAIGTLKEYEDNIQTIMDTLLKNLPPPQKMSASFDPFSYLLIGLAIVMKNQWAINVINEKFLQNPIHYADILPRLTYQTINGYINPEYLQDEKRHKDLKRSVILVSNIIDQISTTILDLSVKLKKQPNEENAEHFRNAYKVIDQVIMSLSYQVPNDKSDQSDKHEVEESKNKLSLYFNEIKLLMDKVLDFALDNDNGVMFAPTAHYFIQTLTSFLDCKPKEVLHLTERVVKSSEPFGYTLDSLAVKEIVDLVEVILADYRDIVRDDDSCMEDLINLLDLFAKTGWPDAQKLVWRLDEVFR
ncbi:hypothetical protein JT359_06680 [Candidatus Poribacteria bacterium]|nr:hypothetical protein [Candidatus Poribacteria bacterium]